MSHASLSRQEVTEIYQRYGYFLQRRARAITRDSGLADDAVQETLVKLLSKGAGYREADHPLRYLHQIVDRSAIDQLRRGRRLRDAAQLDEGATELPAHPAVDLESRDAILKALTQLGEEDQRIAILSLIDGMSQAQVADAVGLSRVTVNKRLQRIKDGARALLDSSPELAAT